MKRRAFLSGGTLLLTGGPLLANSVLVAGQIESTSENTLRLGLVTDLHHADKQPAGTRHYRETLEKLDEAALKFESAGVSTVIELGDFIDAADTVETELGYLKTINRHFSAICKDRHYVLGNHCVDTLNKEEFLDGVQQAKSYYSFDRQGFHFVVLDSCFRHDGTPYGRKNFQWTDANLPPDELEWLQSDLEDTTKPVIVFAHQRLDVSDSHGVKNNAEVRRILEASGKVSAVFQGHSHKNDLKQIGGIFYCTLVAMVEGSGAENNGYSILQLDAQGNIKLQGFRRQESQTL